LAEADESCGLEGCPAVPPARKRRKPTRIPHFPTGFRLFLIRFHRSLIGFRCSPTGFHRQLIGFLRSPVGFLRSLTENRRSLIGFLRFPTGFLRSLVGI